MRRLLLGGFLAAWLAACSMLGGGSQVDDAVLSAGDFGAIGCAGLVTQLSPDDLAKARVATSYARTILASEDPTLAALRAALAAAPLPAQYRALADALLQRVEARLGDAVVLDKEELPFKIAEAFVGACAIALGATP